MKKSVISARIRSLTIISLLAAPPQQAILTSLEHHRSDAGAEFPTFIAEKFAVETGSNAIQVDKSGLRGTTRFIVRSGIPGGQTTGGLRSIEFAIAPIEGEKPAYHKAIFVKSSQEGNYEVALAPGRYWVGPKAKALNALSYRPGPTVLAEEIAVVKEGEFTQLDLVEMGYAP